MSKLYYTAPSDESFEDMKKACLGVWSSKDDTYGYASGKKNQIEHITNVQDNFMYMLAMFDQNNQRAVVDLLQPSTREDLLARLIDGGNAPYIIKMLGL